MISKTLRIENMSLQIRKLQISYRKIKTKPEFLKNTIGANDTVLHTIQEG